MAKKNEVHLSVEEAKARAQSSPFGLDLDDVTSFGPGAAREVAKKHGPLHLNGLKMLTVEDATELAKHEGDLYLNGLPTILESAVRKFALSSCNATLHLNRLAYLSEATAKAIGRFRRDVYLNGIAELSHSNARHISTPGSGFIFLHGMTDIAPDIASVLVKRRGSISLSGIKKLSLPLAEALALATPHRQLRLDGLTDLSPAHAEVIASESRTLWLNGLTSLSNEAARALMRSEGLVLNRLSNVTDSLAAILASMTTSLELTGLEKLSDKAAQSLAKYKGTGLTLKKPQGVSGKTLAALEANPKITIRS